MKILCLCVVWLACFSCKKESTIQEETLQTMFNASDDTMYVMLPCNLYGIDGMNYIIDLYPQYGDKKVLSDTEHGYFVMLFNRPVLTQRKARSFFRMLDGLEKDTSFHYSVGWAATAAKNY